MYESHFGLSGPPFQLNPDPAFYFDSRGHSNALAYLKFGVYQGEGFIVVTGEIGAGKTTLVRTLLEGLNPDQVVAAQVVSTQLESGDLLRSIITAFGIPPLGTTKAHLIATLEGFLTALATKNRRALLIVDEAQNLSLEAIEELRMLSNFQLGKHALLQSFLVGQPELRTLLESKSMEQFRQRVIASCHLGPLDDLETRAYIEHRMRRVGWKDQPHFEPDAFAAIHRWTGGIPRRINLLCNRLLLACFLNGENDISAAQVEQTARELRGEVGEPTVLPQTSPSAARVQPEPGPETAPAGAEPVPAVDRERALSEVVRYQLGPAGPLHAPLVCLIDGPVGYMKAGALAQALREQAELPVLVAVNPGPESAVSAAKALDGALPLPAVEMHLGAAPQGYAAMAAQAQVRFDALLDELQPCAVLALGAGDAVLACSLVAVKRGLPLLRVDAGVRGTHRPATDELNAVLMDRIAEVLFTSKLTAHYTLYREGIASSRVHCVGSLMENVLHVALERAMSPEQALASAAVPDDCLRQPQGYLLVTLGLSGPDPARRAARGAAGADAAQGRDPGAVAGRCLGAGDAAIGRDGEAAAQVRGRAVARVRLPRDGRLGPPGHLRGAGAGGALAGGVCDAGRAELRAGGARRPGPYGRGGRGAAGGTQCRPGRARGAGGHPHAQPQGRTGRGVLGRWSGLAHRAAPAQRAAPAERGGGRRRRDLVCRLVSTAWATGMTTRRREPGRPGA